MYGFNADNNRFEIFTEAQGTGTLRPLSFYTEGNLSQLFLDTNNKVGVGTNTPATELHVIGTTTVSNRIIAEKYSGIIDEFSIAYQDPTVATGTSVTLQKTFNYNITLNSIECSTDTGTTTIQFDERNSSTPNTEGTDVLTSALTCDSSGTSSSSSFNNASISAKNPIKLDINTVAGTPNILRIHGYYEVD